MRVASWFCHQGIARPFDPEGLMNGGKGKTGKLPLSRNAGETPISCVLKLGFVENPWLCVDPVTVGAYVSQNRRIAKVSFSATTVSFE